MISRLRDALSEDKTCKAYWSLFKDPQLVRHIANQGFDAVCLDAQHGFHDEDSILSCVREVVNLGKSPVVRLPVGRWDLAERVLDFGALGVVAPMINTKEDAQRFADACKYPTLGSRSFGPGYAASLYGLDENSYVTQSQTQTLCLAQIETKQAYDNLSDILEIEGIDGILLGPADFSISVTGNSAPDSYGPETIELVRDIARQTKAHGKIAGAFTANTEHALLCHEMGYRFISINLDNAMVANGAASTLKPLSNI